jgi:putative endonuclease
MHHFFVYILASRSKVLYVGMTNDLARRVVEHQQKMIPGFTRRYNVTQLVYWESTPNVRGAIQREKEIKAWRREKKVALIERSNPSWRDLSQHSAEFPRFASG